MHTTLPKQHAAKAKEQTNKPPCLQVDASSAQLAHDQAAIDYCFKPALDYKAEGMSASQAVLRVLMSLKEVADNAQVCFVLGHQQGPTSINSKIIRLS